MLAGRYFGSATGAGELPEQLRQGRDLALVQPREHLSRGADRGHPRPLERLPALWREVDRALAAIVGMGPSLRQVELLQLVDHRHHRARIDHRLLDELSLGAAGVRVDQGEHPEMRGAQAQGLQRRREGPRDALPVPRQEEAGRAGQRLGWRLVGFHRPRDYPTGYKSFVIYIVGLANEVRR